MAEQPCDDERRGSGPTVSPGGVALLVGENSARFQFYSVLLEELGYQVRCSGSYDEGAKLLDSDAFALIVVSQGSLKFEGRRLLERASATSRRPPVLVVAQSPDVQCFLEAMQLGAAEYLTEPVTAQVLVRAVKTHARVPTDSTRAEARTGLGERNAA